MDASLGSTLTHVDASDNEGPSDLDVSGNWKGGQEDAPHQEHHGGIEGDEEEVEATPHEKALEVVRGFRAFAMEEYHSGVRRHTITGAASARCVSECM